jgi:hypothetical protein
MRAVDRFLSLRGSVVGLLYAAQAKEVAKPSAGRELLGKNDEDEMPADLWARFMVLVVSGPAVPFSCC